MLNQILKQQLKNLPSKPGIYQFFSDTDKLLYVGKAKNLKNRVRSYFSNLSSLSPAKQQMMLVLDHLQYTIVNNETEALLLEANLIKQHLPPYNVVLKDDKSWLYVAINYQEPYPTVSLTRQTKQKKFWYYGPFASASSIRYSFNLFKKIFSLKTCPNTFDKPCFNWRLGRCLGHGQTLADKKYYLQQLEVFKKVLNQGAGKIINQLANEMKLASQNEQFEKAAKLRDQWLALKKLGNKQIIINAKNETFDVWGISSNTLGSVVSLLPIRQGSALDTQYFWLKASTNLNDQDKLENFLEQYYPQVTNKPKTTYSNYQLDINLLGLNCKVAKQGNKKKLVNLATKAATVHLEQSLASWQKKTDTAKDGLEQLKKILKLPNLPLRIEGYDISNIQGQMAVGSMVVLKNGLPEPKSYRKFQIKGLNTPNDFAMLSQVLVRRFTHNHDWPKPDLIMLDGGLGQLSTVARILKSYNLNYPIIALAKKQELIFTLHKTKPLKLSTTQPGLRLLQILRDEAHRFGITYYKSRHRSQTIKSAWDDLPGIGPKYKKLLKKEFASLQDLRQADDERLTKIIGLSRAQKLKKYLSQ